MPRYEVYVHIDVLDALSRTGVHRRKILHFIDRLRENPNTLGSYTDKSSLERDRQIKIINDYAITYWPDHASKTVMVVGLKSADV